MHRHAFVMKLKPGAAAEYKRRHDALWPEMAQILRDAGVSDYRIFLDEDSGTLFAVQTRADGHSCDGLPEHPVVKQWWAHMASLMETNPDQSPVETPLTEVFHLP